MLRRERQPEWLMIEKDNSFHTLAISNVVRGYGAILQEDRTSPGIEYDIPPVPEDYHTIEP
jgi:hypothetical protein